MVEIKLTPEEEKLLQYVFSDKPEHQKVLLKLLKSIINDKVRYARAEFYGVTINNTGDLYIDGYLALINNELPPHIVEMHITINSELEMKFEAGALWFYYNLRDKVEEFLKAFEGEA
mgnify:CR=1 FL=1